MWHFVALLPPAIFLPMVFLANVSHLNNWWLVVLWILLGILNPWIEEGSWRGLLMDAATERPRWPASAREKPGGRGTVS